MAGRYLANYERGQRVHSEDAGFTHSLVIKTAEAVENLRDYRIPSEDVLPLRFWAQVAVVRQHSQAQPGPKFSTYHINSSELRSRKQSFCDLGTNSLIVGPLIEIHLEEYVNESCCAGGFLLQQVREVFHETCAHR